MKYKCQRDLLLQGCCMVTVVEAVVVVVDMRVMETMVVVEE